MSIRASFSVTRAWSEAAGFLPRALAGAWLSLLLLWAFVAVAPQGVMQQVGHPRLIHLAVPIISLILKMIALGALYRLALFGNKAREEGLGFGGLQFALPEMRLLGSGVIIGLFIAMIAATLFIVFAIAANISGIDLSAVHVPMGSGAMRLAGPEAWLICACVLAAVFLLGFLVFKFVLAQAATIAQSRMVTLNALGLSSGNVGKLFAGLVVIVGPLAVLAGAAFHHMNPRFVLSPKPAAFDGGLQLHMVLHAALMALAVFVVMPLCAGFLSSAYRQIVKNRSQ